MSALIKLIALILLLASGALSSKAQVMPDHQAIVSPTWGIIGDLRYKEVQPGEYAPVFSRSLKSLEGKEVELEGYMVPYERGIKHSRFALSVLPIFQCQFCGSGGFPPMVEVEAKEPVNFTYKPFKMKGRIRLNPDNIDKLEIILEEAYPQEK